MISLATTTRRPRKRVTFVDDVHFVDALSFEFRPASKIARNMLEAGHAVTLTEIVERMGEFVEVGGVEACGRSWRIELHAPPTGQTDYRGLLPAIAVESPANDILNLHNSCGLEMMRSMPSDSADLVIADLPYGVFTANGFDPKIDVQEWMDEMRRIVTRTGVIAAFGNFNFAVRLAAIAPDILKQTLIWDKQQGSSAVHSKFMHMQSHEYIVLFSKGGTANNAKHIMTFNPQGVERILEIDRRRTRVGMCGTRGGLNINYSRETVRLKNCPLSVLRYRKDSRIHSFAKPIALLEYLVRTFSNDNALVVDPTMGSGSTAIAMQNVGGGRRFLGAENGTDNKGRDIFQIAVDRIAASA